MNLNKEKKLSKKRWSCAERLDIGYKIAGIIGAFSVLISALGLLLTLYPQLIPGNDNLVNKANAGHIKSQMLLAEHYFEIGEYADSIYWYKLACANEGKYQASAYNNLGYIYANGFGLSNDENDNYYIYEKAYQLFRAAHDLGLLEGQRNAISVLRMNDRECFPNLDQTDINTFLDDNYYSIVESTHYKSFEKSMGKFFWVGNTKYTFSGTFTAPAQDSNWTKTYWMYYGQTYKDDEEIMSYEFVYLSELTD